jgi:hypothetical protein
VALLERPSASRTLAPPSYSFELCAGATCGSPLEQTIADATNSWDSSLSGNLTAGLYTIGITDLGPLQDPQYTITFDTAINQIAGVPEPSTWAMMMLGFAGLGYAGYRRARVAEAA